MEKIAKGVDLVNVENISFADGGESTALSFVKPGSASGILIWLKVPQPFSTENWKGMEGRRFDVTYSQRVDNTSGRVKNTMLAYTMHDPVDETETES